MKILTSDFTSSPLCLCISSPSFSRSVRAAETLLARLAQVIPCDSSAHVVMLWAHLSLILPPWNDGAAGRALDPPWTARSRGANTACRSQLLHIMSVCLVRSRLYTCSRHRRRKNKSCMFCSSSTWCTASGLGEQTRGRAEAVIWLLMYL